MIGKESNKRMFSGSTNDLISCPRMKKATQPPPHVRAVVEALANEPHAH